jgi:hypothetical protein
VQINKETKVYLYSHSNWSYDSDVVACPFFYPTEKVSLGWPFPARLPLGAGFTGTCRAGADEIAPSETELRDFCNMGYAGGCPHMPANRCVDNVRFAVARDEESRIILHYVSERCHQPEEYGRLEYDCRQERWLAPMRDPCLQRQAECYVAVYLERRPRTARIGSDNCIDPAANPRKERE